LGCVLSQAGEGWEQVEERYDDGGWSGGSMDRPGLKQLLADVEAGKVDIIVVYKVDRLTRSLADFAKIVDILDAKGASFVSVTQAFNTTNSMGRLTLNVLLSFAQFEREVTGERIRDKIAASKRKGMWMGGAIPLGYRVEARRLVIDETEEAQVRHIFNRYLELKSVPALAEDLAAKGFRTRARPLKDGRSIGNVPFGKGALGQLLKNVTYTGKVRHHDEIFDGEHDAIIDPDTFDLVQQTLAKNRYEKAVSKTAASPSLLARWITDPEGRPMSPVRGQKGHLQYCYYTTRFRPGEDRTSVCRVPAGAIDRLVTDRIAEHLKTAPQADEAQCKVAWQIDHLQSRDAGVGMGIMKTHQLRALFMALDVRVQLQENTIEITLRKSSDNEPTTLSVPARLVRRGNEVRVALVPDGSSATSAPDPTLIRLMAQAFAARDHLLSGKDAPLIAKYDQRHQQRLARLSWLAPDIVSAILDGTQPVQLTARHLIRCATVPLEWQQQREFLGFAQG
jgi:site-specific DNA recombinase